MPNSRVYYGALSILYLIMSSKNGNMSLNKNSFFQNTNNLSLQNGLFNQRMLESLRETLADISKGIPNNFKCF